MPISPQTMLWLCYKLDDRRIEVRFLAQPESFLFPTESRAAPVPTQHPIQWVTQTVVAGINWPGRDPHS
jgi:hypothetical protein